LDIDDTIGGTGNQGTLYQIFHHSVFFGGAKILSGGSVLDLVVAGDDGRHGDDNWNATDAKVWAVLEFDSFD
jgi:hypothetical protein